MKTDFLEDGVPCIVSKNCHALTLAMASKMVFRDVTLAEFLYLWGLSVSRSSCPTCAEQMASCQRAVTECSNSVGLLPTMRWVEWRFSCSNASDYPNS